jgi:hypothetical protein
MLGVTAAWSFSNGGSSLRMFWAPGILPLDASNTGFILGVPVIWTGVLAAIASIPLLAARMRAGWRLSVVGVGILFMGNLILFASLTGTKEFMIGIIMSVISLGLLFTPAIRSKLIGRVAQPSSRSEPAEPSMIAGVTR